MSRRENTLGTMAITMVCLTIGVVAATTTAVALAKQSGELPPASVEQTPQAAIDETFAILRAHSIDITPTARPQAGSCSSFNAEFLDAKCAKVHRKRAGRGRHVATFVPGGTRSSE